MLLQGNINATFIGIQKVGNQFLLKLLFSYIMTLFEV